MLLYEGRSRFLAATAAGTDRQPALYFAEGLGAVLDGLADLSVGDGMADANVHNDPDPGTKPRPQGGMVNTNENDCQL
jgi:hypothetical protein